MFARFIKNIRMDTAGPEILVAVLAFVSVLFLGISIVFVREQRRTAVRKRLEATGSRAYTVLGRP